MIRHFGLVAALVLGVASVVPLEGQSTLPTYLACEDTTGATPAAMASADFDRNGLADVAVLDEQHDAVVVLLTDPELLAVGACVEGTELRTITVGDSPRGVAVGDFDANGKTDMVVVESRGARVLGGDGSGGFTSQAPIPAGSDPRSVVTGDFDGDGAQDIVVGTGTDRTVEILYGITGGGFLEPPVSISVGQTVTAMVAADLNVDGRRDLALLSYESGTVTVLLRDADEPRRFEKLAAFAGGQSPTSLTTGDFDRDGNPDLALTASVSSQAGEVVVFFGTPMGESVSFTERAEFSVPAGPNPSAAAVGDFNADGWLDAVVANKDGGTIGFYVGGGTEVLEIEDPCAEDACADGCCVAANPRVVAAVRLDADARPDIVVGSEQDGTMTFLFSSDPSSTPTRTLTLTPTETPTPTLTPTVTETPTVTPTLTPTSTNTLIPSRTFTPSRTPTVTGTKTPGPFSLQGDSCAIDTGQAGGQPLLPVLFGAGLLVLRLLRRAKRRAR